MFYVIIDPECCEGCSDCVEMCPDQLLEVREVDGKKIAVFAGDPEDCQGCESCLAVCENGCITIEEY
jgi:NAD-dependent dihydropyrimidine dehydrogenase PreA subunit